jgi:hypothetical protein
MTRNTVLQEFALKLKHCEEEEEEEEEEGRDDA